MQPSETQPIKPWRFVPILYFMQAMPVTIVQEVSSIFYKDLGIANASITQWTSLIALPWSLQFLLGPLVDLSGKKRDWIFGAQFLIAIGLGVTAMLLKLPHAFELTLVILGATAIVSALCNIATDGFYILTLSREQQAAFVGLQSTFYRLGRLFCVGILVFSVGKLTALPRIVVTTPARSFLRFLDDKKEVVLSEAQLGVNNSAGGELTDQRGRVLQPPISLPRGTTKWGIRPDGLVLANDLVVGKIAVLRSGNAPVTLQFDGSSETKAPMLVETGWALIVMGAAAVYFLGFLWARRTTPSSPSDIVPADAGELGGNIRRSVAVVVLGLATYFTANSLVRLGAHALWMALGGNPAGNWKGWMLPEHNTILGFDFGLGGVGTECAQLLVAMVIAGLTFAYCRRSIRGTQMGDAFSSFLAQSGIWAILGFLLFYRFGEAMVAKMSPLFLKDTIASGGLAVANDRIGLIKGFAGVIGIVLGGICGGLFVSKIGLRKAFWPMAFLMHVPNLFYLWAALYRPPSGSITLYGVEFVDQFGYGFGFAGYMVYLMWVAQRGRYQTAHYAIGTGLGAMFIALAGIVSGVIQSNFGYPAFFASVIFLTLPGMAMLAFIPLEEAPQKA